jgi:hypothetical protein
MSKKEIKINPSFLQYGSSDSNKKKGRGSSTTRKNDQKKKEELLKVNDSSVRDLLLKRLKEYRKNKTKKQEHKHGQSQNVSSEFIQSLRKKRNKTANSVKIGMDEPIDSPPLNVSKHSDKSEEDCIDLDDPNVFTEVKKNNTETSESTTKQALPTISMLPEPQYSNLKNSDKPTYRELYNKPLLSEHENIKEDEIKDVSEITIQSNKPTKEVMEIAVEKVFKVGKNKTQKKIGVFIKNNKIKRKNQEDKVKLKRTNFKTVKNYLKKNNLVKYGTKAPTDLLRAIYESSKIVGDVKNVNGENLIHNYVNVNE